MTRSAVKGALERYSGRMLLAVVPTPIADSTPTWVVGLVGALVAGMLALLGGLIQGRREHSRWILQKRHEAHAAFIEQVDLADSMTTTKSVPPDAAALHEFFKGLYKATSDLALLGPEYVIREADSLRNAVASRMEIGAPPEAYANARARYVRASRRALKISPWYSRLVHWFETQARSLRRTLKRV
jgi:hypothetical protein